MWMVDMMVGLRMCNLKMTIAWEKVYMKVESSPISKDNYKENPWTWKGEPWKKEKKGYYVSAS